MRLRRAVVTLLRWSGPLGLAVTLWAVSGCDPSGRVASPPGARYVGVQVCRECHPSAWRAWLGSRHARSAVSLQTALARGIAGREGERRQHLTDSPACLRCHGVGARPAKSTLHLSGSHPEEGVTCEACHGPASLHVEAARSRKPRPGLVVGLRHPERPCQDCHKPKPSHEHDLAEPYEPEAYLARIRHGLEDPPLVDWLPRSPAGGAPGHRP